MNGAGLSAALRFGAAFSQIGSSMALQYANACRREFTKNWGAAL